MPNQSIFIVSQFKINTGPKPEKQERKLNCDITYKVESKKYTKPEERIKRSRFIEIENKTSDTARREGGGGIIGAGD